MRKSKIVSLLLAFAMVSTCFAPVAVGASEGNGVVTTSSTADFVYNFTSTNVDGAINLGGGSVPVYDSTKGYGFVEKTSAIPQRTVANPATAVQMTSAGATITEDGTGGYLSSEANNGNNGGLVFRVDVAELGAYNLKVTTTGGTSADTWIAPSGMQASRLTGPGAWDSAGLVPKTNYITWDGTTWSYDYSTGRKYIEFEIEPSVMAKAGSPKTVGVASIEITKIANNTRETGEKPNIFVLGDSTQKTYTFEEASMSGWGQIINKMFDLSKVNVVNYSMGGRSMKASHDEGRFNEVLMVGNVGDYVLIHSAHNDETTDGNLRFGRGSISPTGTVYYSQWLNDIYIPALRARGLIPVLVTPQPRTGNGVPTIKTPDPKFASSSNNQTGFSPDSPNYMREAAANNSDVELVELFDNAVAYDKTYGAAQTLAIYMSIEAGESPGKTNSGSYANGHPDGKTDGTHYKEAAAKVWSKIIAEQIYKQGITNASSASAKMQELAGYLNPDVKEACANEAAQGDAAWQAKVFPEWANDVSIVKDTTTSAMTQGTPYYYRNQIEKMLQLGAMKKDTNGNFNPNTNIATNDFISSLCAIWALDPANDVFKKYYTSGTLTREVMATIILDAYELRFGKNADGSWVKPDYMTKYNGFTVSPDDPNYDPNLIGAEAQYYPLSGWGNLTDKNDISLEYAKDFYEVYNLGLMRSEKGIARGTMKNGTELEPKASVTRAKAAKELWFLWVLGHNSVKDENQRLDIYASGIVGGTPQAVAYNAVNYTAPKYEFSAVNINSDGSIKVDYTCNGTAGASDKLTIKTYDINGTTLLSTKEVSVTGSGTYTSTDINLTTGQSVVMQFTDGTTALSAERTAVCTELIVPVRSYTASTVAGIKNGTMALENLSDPAETEDQATTSSVNALAEKTENGTMWWTASEDVTKAESSFMNGMLKPTFDMQYKTGNVAIGGQTFSGYVDASAASMNGYLDGHGSGFVFTPNEDGIVTAYIGNLGANKNFVVVPVGSTLEAQAVAGTKDLGLSGNCSLSAVVTGGTSYYITGLGTKARYVAISFIGGAKVVNTLAKKGETVQISATPNEGYKVSSVTATNSTTSEVIPLNYKDDTKTISTFIMPESDVSITATFIGNDEPNPTVPPSTGYTIGDSSVIDGNISVALTGTGSAALIVAGYDAGGALTGTKIINVDGTETYPTGFAVSGSSRVKLLVWDNMDRMKPLSDAKTVTISPTPTSTPVPTLIPTSTPVPTVAPSPEPSVDPAKVLTVDGTKETDVSQNLYKTITEAITVAKAKNPASEADRLYINIEPGIYTEQVVLDGVDYITLRKDPASTGEVKWEWYYCTGYMYSNVGLDAKWDSTVDWTNPGTWYGYKDVDGNGNVIANNEEDFPVYKMNDAIQGKTISYYDINDVKHTGTATYSNLGSFQGMARMAPLCIDSGSDYITLNGIYFINTNDVYVTQQEKDAHVTPQSTMPSRTNLSVCAEDTPEKSIGNGVITDDLAVYQQDPSKYAYFDATKVYDAGESAYIVRSKRFNERGHALYSASNHLIMKNCKLRGNQDSMYLSDGAAYVENCNLIGGTDYIYGEAQAVFNNCRLGAEGYSDQTGGATITAASTLQTDRYGMLFFNCSMYNVRSNTTTSVYGRPWGANAQVTFYNTAYEKTDIVSNPGWSDMSVSAKDARFFEYGTKNPNGSPVNLSSRTKNTNGIGTVLDQWQILEYNPRNYLKGWDPMSFGSTYLADVDKALNDTTITIPSSNETTFDLPTAPTGLSFKWESSSSNATVSTDGTKLTVIRPAFGESSISSSVILYAMDNTTKFGDRKVIPIIITPTSDKDNTYTVTGTVTLSKASTSDEVVTIKFMSGNAVIKTMNVTIPAGDTSKQYTAEYIPVGTYTTVATIGDADYNIGTPSQTVTGVKGGTATFDVLAKKMQTITISSGDFSNPGYTPSIASASGFNAALYTATGSETANLGAENVVFKMTKDVDAKIAANVGASFDLRSMLPSGGSFNNTKKIQFSFDFLCESTAYLPSGMDSFFDLATSKSNAGAKTADKTRFVRYNVYTNWCQFNFYNATNARINGDNTQFNKNSMMANKWYKMVADIDLETKTVTVTAYDRDSNTVLNGKAFNIAVPDVTGASPNYPTAIDLSNLYFNIYMDAASSTNKMEYYFDNIELGYQDFE